MHERKSGSHRKIDGLCGLRYNFLYDEEIKAYCYAPKTEKEAEDIFSTVGRMTGAAFAPVSIETSVSTTVKPDPVEEVVSVNASPATTGQIEACIVRGIIITEDDSEETVERLLDLARKLDEMHAIQLAAISTASVQNTESSKLERIGRDNPYWTVAYGDVCVAVDREIRVRDGVAEANKEPTDTRTPAEKRAATNAAKKAATPK